MRPCILDASVWLAAYDASDPNFESSAELLKLAADGHLVLAALDLTLYEVGNAATVGWQDPDKAKEVSKIVSRSCESRIVRADDLLMSLAANLASEHRITVYDAAYAVASRETTWPLISCDVKDLVGKQLALDPQTALAMAKPNP
ncbi:MAG: type II toxin-antitoxin system VapC family toxin [Solirubrobacterales bacterium]